MIQDVITVGICFELNNDPKNFRLTDSTDYAGQGIALTDVVGIFKILAPDGTVAYENSGFASDDFSSPDIDADVSLIFSSALLPLDSENNVQLGNYTVQYKIEVIGAVQPGQYSKNTSVENCHEDPTVTIEQSVDCFNSKLTSTDTTVYGTEKVPTPTSVVRTHTAYAPPTSGLPDTVTSNKINVVTPIATKTWTLGISTDVQWDYPDGLCIINTLTGNEEVEVVCEQSLCDLFCCIDKLYQRYLGLLGSNTPLAMEEKVKLEFVAMDMILFQQASECGDVDKAKTYYDHILAVTGCEPGCSCDDEDFSVVIPVCVTGGTAVVDACGNGAIAVTANTVGDTTTYTVCFDQTLLDKLNAYPAAPIFKQAVVNISSAEILALDSTPKVLLAAQAGIAYDVESVVLVFQQGTTDYATSITGDTGLRVHVVGPGGFDEARWIAPEDNLVNLNSLIALGYSAWVNEMQDAFLTTVLGNPTYSNGDNTRFELKAVGGNFTLGDHTIKAVVTYKEIPLP